MDWWRWRRGLASDRHGNRAKQEMRNCRWMGYSMSRGWPQDKNQLCVSWNGIELLCFGMLQGVRWHFYGRSE